MMRIVGTAVVCVLLALWLPAPADAEPAFCAKHEQSGAPHTPGNLYITACRGDDGNGGCDTEDQACEPLFDWRDLFPGLGVAAPGVE